MPAASQPRIIGSAFSDRPTPRSDHRSWWLSAAALTVTVVQPRAPRARGARRRRGRSAGPRGRSRRRRRRAPANLPRSAAEATVPAPDRMGHGPCRRQGEPPAAAAPDRVLEFLRDYRESRPRILTDNWSAYRVEQGGRGEGPSTPTTSPRAVASATTGCTSPSGRAAWRSRTRARRSSPPGRSSPAPRAAWSRSSPRGRARAGSVGSSSASSPRGGCTGSTRRCLPRSRSSSAPEAGRPAAASAYYPDRRPPALGAVGPVRARSSRMTDPRPTQTSLPARAGGGGR